MGKLFISVVLVALSWDLMTSEPGQSVLMRAGTTVAAKIKAEYEALAQGGSIISSIQSFLNDGVANYEQAKGAGRIGPSEESTDLATIVQSAAIGIWREISSWFGASSGVAALKMECRNALAIAANQSVSKPQARTAERNRYRMLEAETSEYFDRAAREVRDAIHCASLLTDVDQDYLIETAFKESGFDPRAKARRSSAAGLYQFVDQTWYAMIYQRGKMYGLTEFSSSITKTTSGKYKSESFWNRGKVLNLRYNAKVNAIMAAELAIANQSYLVRKFNRAPSRGELYAAHFLGVGSAERLIKLNISAPTNGAASHFPKAAKANRRVFYTDNGTPITVAQLHALLIGGNEEPPQQIEQPIAQRESPSMG